MKTSTKTLIAAGVAVAVGAIALTGVTQASGSKEGRGYGGHHYAMHGGHGHKGGHHGRHSERRFERLLESYDSNEDGKLTQAEIDAVRAERLAKFDSDGDGSLTLQEYEALWLDAMRERMVDRFQSHDDDGDGRVTAEEFGERFSKLVARRDRDGDGEITREDFRHGKRGRDDDD
ncbi:MAG: caleosin family protein [Kiloniellales bacterium]|nr:caleosin family protein [Kiloniellales bacterium]